MPSEVCDGVHAEIPEAEGEVIGDFTPWGGVKASLGWIENEVGCHLWTGNRNNQGYAQARVARKLWLVHRWRYENEVGPIPAGMGLDHYVCDNGPGGCCNPLHCRPASQRENMLRGKGIGARYAARTHCGKGHLLSDDNLIPSEVIRVGARVCLTCHKATQRARYERKVGRAVYRLGSIMCRAGLHRLEGDNLMACYLRKGQRACRACSNAKQREGLRRRRELAGRPIVRVGRPVGHTTGDFCGAGLHPLSGDNLMPGLLKRGFRKCRACNNEKQRARAARKKQQTA